MQGSSSTGHDPKVVSGVAHAAARTEGASHMNIRNWLSAKLGRRLSLLAVAGALVTGSIALAGPAQASATGCAYYGGIGSIKGIPIYNGNYCATVDGSGSYVYDVQASVSSYGTICNWDITAEFFDANWHWHQTRVSSHHYGCGHTGWDWIPIDDMMRNLVGSPYGYMCSTLRVAGQRVTSVCHYIHP